MPKKYIHEVKLIKISEVRANAYNPNVIDPRTYSQLVRRISEEGFLQPIVVRCLEVAQDQIKYEIIDGEHRYRAAVELEYEEIPAIILDKSLPEAMVGTINMNKLRGEFDVLKLAEIIQELSKTYTIEEIEDKLGYTPDEVTGLGELLSFDFNSFKPDIQLGEEEGLDIEHRLEVVLTKQQDDIIKKAIRLTKKSEVPDALVDICSEYIMKHHGKGTT